MKDEPCYAQGCEREKGHPGLHWIFHGHGTIHAWKSCPSEHDSFGPCRLKPGHSELHQALGKYGLVYWE